MLTLHTVSTECLIRNRNRIREMWRNSPEDYPDGCWPMEKLYDAIVAELKRRNRMI